MKNNIIVDLDGTLAVIDHRLHLVEGTEKDWHGFFRACVDDKPNRDIIETVGRLAYSGSSTENLVVHIFSGRSAEVHRETVEWLDRHLHFSYSLDMRPIGDHRPDDVLKKEMVNGKGLTPDNVLCIFDDRKSVVDMWRREGFTCLQVADRDF